jgi:uncharacterized protein YkwD
MFALALSRRAVTVALAGSAIVFASLTPAAPASPAASAAARCANADLEPNAANLVTIRRATLCLLNAERRRRGRGRLRSNARLRTAAQRYAEDMVRRSFFDHVSPGGSTLVDRLRATAYVRSARSWSVGENLAVATGSLATPAAIMRGWMRSPGHRANILRRKFREVGIGVALGTPDFGSDGATYTTNFGRRG